MSEDHNPSLSDKLTAAYDLMLERMHAAAEKAEPIVHAAAEKLEPMVDAATDKAEPIVDAAADKAEAIMNAALKSAREKASELGELSREEAEKVSDYIKRDLEDAADYLNREGGELKDWLKFDLDVVEQRVGQIFSESVDRTREAIARFELEANKRGEWHSGEVTGIGTLECKACGEKLHFHKTGHIPPCPKCHGSRFRRISSSDDA